MRSTDIPQANDLDRVREVVQAVKTGATMPMLVHRATRISPRHVLYYLNAARLLGWLDRQGRGEWRVTPEGVALLATSPSSSEEREGFQDAIRKSPVLRELAPDLLAKKAPPLERLVRRIVDVAALADATARRRAQTLLSWRHRALNVKPELFPQAEDGTLRKAAPKQRIEPEQNAEGMILQSVRIERYGPIRSLRTSLRPFTVLIGRNATGKSTFMDSLSLVSDCLNLGIPGAIESRAGSFEDLVWNRRGASFEFAFEFALPRKLPLDSRFDAARYEVAIGPMPDGSIGNLWERLFLKPAGGGGRELRTEKKPPAWRQVLSLSEKGTAWFGSERTEWKTVITLGHRKLALSEVLDDRTRFPVACRVRDLLKRGVQRLALDPRAMVKPCSPRTVPTFLPDGSNVPLVVKRLKERDPTLFDEWTAHLREALPDVVGIHVMEREDDRHLYLKLTYRGGLDLPAWRLSEGTLRILALTLIPFAAEPDAIYLIEEPENGIHPQAIEAVHQVLSEPFQIQILVATHSPIFVGIVKPEELLCFSRPAGGPTAVVSGDNHPALRSWRQEIDLGTLFAAKVLE